MPTLEPLLIATVGKAPGVLLLCLGLWLARRFVDAAFVLYLPLTRPVTGAGIDTVIAAGGTFGFPRDSAPIECRWPMA
jgi:putative ABC transport system permease protein